MVAVDLSDLAQQVEELRLVRSSWKRNFVGSDRFPALRLWSSTTCGAKQKKQAGSIEHFLTIGNNVGDVNVCPHNGIRGEPFIPTQPFVALRILFTEQTGETMVKQIFPVILALIPLVAVCGAVAACP